MLFHQLRLGQTPIVVEKPESAGFSAERFSRLDKSMQGYVDRKEVAGAVALVARRGKVVYHKSFGYRDAETEAPMSNDVIFRIASMSKPIVSVALMMLWEEGHFQLQVPKKCQPVSGMSGAMTVSGLDSRSRTPESHRVRSTNHHGRSYLDVSRRCTEVLVVEAKGE